MLPTRRAILLYIYVYSIWLLINKWWRGYNLHTAYTATQKRSFNKQYTTLASNLNNVKSVNKHISPRPYVYYSSRAANFRWIQSQY